MGWFDGNPVSMYSESPESVYPDLVKLAGGASEVVAFAQPLLKNGEVIKALRMVEAALKAEPDNRSALELRLQVLTTLRQQSGNFNESGWLNFGLAQTRRKLEAQAEEY